MVQVIIIAARLQVLKTVPDSLFRQAAYPKPLKRLPASGKFIDVTKDQFSLPPGVGANDYPATVEDMFNDSTFASITNC
jgi:hypothetical protein